MSILSHMLFRRGHSLHFWGKPGLETSRCQVAIMHDKFDRIYLASATRFCSRFAKQGESVVGFLLELRIQNTTKESPIKKRQSTGPFFVKAERLAPWLPDRARPGIAWAVLDPGGRSAPMESIGSMKSKLDEIGTVVNCL